MYDDARLLLLVVSKETEARRFHEHPASQPRGLGEGKTIQLGKQLLLAYLDHLSHSLHGKGGGGGGGGRQGWEQDEWPCVHPKAIFAPSLQAE